MSKQTSLKSLFFTLPFRTAILIICFMGILFTLSQYFSYEQSTSTRAKTVAQILSRNLVSAISFEDYNEVLRVLSTAKEMNDVVQISLYEPKKHNLIQRYSTRTEVKDDSSLLSIKDVLQFDQGEYCYNSPIMEGGQEIAYLVIRLSTEGLKRFFLETAIMLCAGFFISVLLAFAFSYYVQRRVSKKIDELVTVIEKISNLNDLSIRILSNTDQDLSIKEFDTLSERFNQMLNVIKEKDDELKNINLGLEGIVEERTRELKDAQKHAIAHAHSAGMAEVASAIIHNVGNVLNSLNVSMNAINSMITSSKISSLFEIKKMLEAHKENLSEFILHDPKGKLIPEYLVKLCDKLKEEQCLLLQETTTSFEKLALIKDVITSQQNYARPVALAENLYLSQAVDDALKITLAISSKKLIKIVKNYNETRMTPIQKNKVIHIIVNILKNAKEALEMATHHEERYVEIHTWNDDTKTYLTIKDNGCGIPTENLLKIFNHGFTTKEKGHGFGVHYCATTMKEMNGDMVVNSEGKDRGAMFTLTFPSAS